MRNVTIFTMPRQFVDNFKIIQYNAIRSWLALKPTPEVILCGNDAGVAEAAAELGVVHIPNIKLSAEGTPLISSVFTEAKAVAKNEILVCSNSDILLTNDFLDALDTVTTAFPHKFMVVGQRWDLEITDCIDFHDSSWEDRLRNDVAKCGTMHPACGIDYFVFEKELSIEMLPFPVGRGYWDNWFMAKALHVGLNVIDATEKIFAVHQNHRRFHMKEYQNNRSGAEYQRCGKLANGLMAFISHANWIFQNDILVKK
ncbi:MAG TPA: hypothetical protein VMX17_14180 [Candidatus Glassbacteria bacterium]|nr:hypothetical protein [Candidatus Glassbacteria bacterium]